MKKTVIILAHPNTDYSTANKIFSEEIPKESTQNWLNYLS